MRRVLMALGVALLTKPVRADEGGLTLDSGGGLALHRTRPSYSAAHPALSSRSGTVMLGLRYGLSHHWEASVAARYDLPSVLFHADTDVLAMDSLLPGTLRHELSRESATLGLRRVTGLVWRPGIALEAGLCRRRLTGFRLLRQAEDGSNEAYALSLPDRTLWSPLLAVGVGLEWQAGDSLSFGVQPRLEWLPGSEATVAASLLLVISWSFFP